MYIISNYLSIIIVIGIIDNLAADYPTQFFLMKLQANGSFLKEDEGI